MTALKMLFGIGFVLSGIFMYTFVFQMSKSRFAGFVAGFLYMFAPYQFLTLYVSAAIGTEFVFMFLPILFLGVYFITQNRCLKGAVVMGVGGAGIILSHFMTFVMLTPLIGLYSLGMMLLYRENVKHKIIAVFLGGVIALGLSFFYVAPMLESINLIKSNNVGSGFTELFMNNFPDFKQLIYSKWGFGPIISNAKDGEISFQLGISQWLGVFGILLVSLLSLIHHKFQMKHESLLVLLFGSSVFLITDHSKLLWSTVSKHITVDYPFRYLVPAVFFSSVLCGLWLHRIQHRYIKILIALLLVVIALYTNRNHIRVNLYTHVPIEDYIDAETTTNTFNEYLPKSAQSGLINKPYVPLQLVSADQKNDVTYTVLDHRLNYLKINCVLKQSTVVRLGQYVFPGVFVKVDEKVSAYQVAENGLITLELAAGDHVVEVGFKPTNIQMVSYYISSIFGITIALVAILYLYRNYHENHCNNASVQRSGNGQKNS
jgi:hypothetical protein